MSLDGTMLPQTTTLPKDPLFSKILEIANQRGDQFIVDDQSHGTQFGYRHILHGIVTLQEKLKGLLDRLTWENRGAFFVALLAPSGYEFIVGTLTVLALGGVVVPTPTGALPAEASHMLQQCGACCLLFAPEQVELATQIRKEVEIPLLAIEGHVDDVDSLLPLTSYTLDPALAVSEECPCILFFTSGTTGPPKGVLHARRSLNKYVRTDKIEPSDEICIIPRGAFWSIYFMRTLQMLLLGVSIAIHDYGRNYNLIWEIFRERKGTKIMLLPTFWYGLMKYYQDHISKLPDPTIKEYIEGFQYFRDVGMTGAMPSSRLKEFWQNLRGGRPLKVQYGTTETQEISAWDVTSDTSEADLGTPLPNVIMKLSEGDTGEVLVKTPSLFLRYLNLPDATAERFDSEGFFKTGDLAICQNGRYIFQGRANMDMFKFYTYKVPRIRVETYLLALPYVAEGYILPVEDPECDTRTAALVRFHSGDVKIDLHTLRKDLSKDMPAYQLPTVLRVLRDHETVPRTWSDKVAMTEVVHMFFPRDNEDRLCGEATDVLDISQFMKAEYTKMWTLSGMRQ